MRGLTVTPRLAFRFTTGGGERGSTCHGGGLVVAGPVISPDAISGIRVVRATPITGAYKREKQGRGQRAFSWLEYILSELPVDFIGMENYLYNI